MADELGFRRYWLADQAPCTLSVKGMTMSGKCATTHPSFGEQEGRHLVLGVHPMLMVDTELMVDTDAVVVERLMLADGLTCPGCG
ncbi:MAG TPA: hypothetical protein VFF32_09025, partial [Dermatophilaceae bacterium]|nr:hypothetical protein [Dermatophilaceae bacterium]